MLPYNQPQSADTAPAPRVGSARIASRSWLALAGALLAAGSFAGPAAADVRAGNTITAFPDREMIAAEGRYSGDVTVELLRNGIVIGRAAGPAQSVAGGSGLEVNHGPLGAAGPGDCWNGLTPDVRGGDVVRVTDASGTDEMTVGGVGLNPAGPLEQPDGSIVLNATAVQPDGTALDVGSLTAEVRHRDPVYRATGTVQRAADGALTATYSAPYASVKGGNFSVSQQKEMILDGSHMLVHSPVASEVTIAELGEAGGPAPGCESAPLQADAVTTSDDTHVNLTSGDLVLSGTARAETTGVTIALGSLNADVEVPAVEVAAELSAGDGPKTWTATVTRDQLETLPDGRLQASGTYTTPAGDLTGAPLEIVKDLVAPEPPASNPAPGTYTSAQSIALAHSDNDAGTRMVYTTNGTDPTVSSTRANAPIWVTATQTIKAMAIDSAGNPSAVATLGYTIQPAVAPAAVPVPAPVPVAAPAPQPPAAPSSIKPAVVTGLEVTSRASGRTIARRGLTVAFSASEGVAKVRVRLMKGTKVMATRTVTTPAAKRYSVRFAAKALRKLAPGAYQLEARPLDSDGATTSKLRVRVTR